MSVIARCCWCNRPFRQGRMLRADVWACPTEACLDRCMRFAITYRKASDKAKDNQNDQGIGNNSGHATDTGNGIDMATTMAITRHI